VTAPAVDLRSIAVLREGYPVLRRLDLRVAPGDVVLLTGANGAGKTTLLHALAGLLPVAAGDGTVLGHSLLTARDQVRRRVSLVGHESFCYDDLTVRENLMFHARLAGLGRTEAEAGLCRLGLETIADRQHGRLSAGQRRRCALAVATVRDSELVLLDEPHAALDHDGRELVDLAIADAAARGSTVVVVSHEPELIRPFSQRELVMDDGRLQAVPADEALPKM
jgi:heme ABC exporter ATP-binding subunit CcmA